MLCSSDFKESNLITFTFNRIIQFLFCEDWFGGGGKKGDQFDTTVSEIRWW